MRTKIITMAAASAALIVSTPLLAQQQNGGGNREQARSSSQGPANANQRGRQQADRNSVLRGGQSGGGMDHRGHNMQDHRGHTMQDGQSMRDGRSMRRQNSQGRDNAFDRARQQANANSAIAQGMEVRDRSGRRLGQVREVVRSPQGVVTAIVVVVVVQVNGTNMVTLPAGSFTIVNNVVVVNNINLSVTR